MSDTDVYELLNRVGKRFFIEHYYDLKALYEGDGKRSSLVEGLIEDITEKSKYTRVTKAKRIFREGLEREALQIILSSRHPRVQELQSLA
ncbi:hypothetical protein [Ectobacillus ponti]|uniref:Uncharacterized protein n=1 Tax=Ectobacillus ponti TaxID=2961894 RepID=A0AA42BQH5_9BACI|nr:hypothetical protein [Ectobacillus ponti]MCP8968454.1 hypothetical protein [Ectobacillus ponti]